MAQERKNGNSDKSMTAVEWLVDQLKIRGYAGEFPPHLLFEQAKEIEKEQIKEAYLQGDSDAIDNPRRSAEQYYNETYGKE